jgi:hypothetical protein
MPPRARLADGHVPSVAALALLAITAACQAPTRAASITPTPSPSAAAPALIEVIPRASTVDVSPADEVVCDGRTARGGGVHHLRTCADDLVAAVVRWRPDALVALGGGILGPDQPACSTVQRAHTTAQLFDALGRTPWLVLSGEGRHEPATPLTGSMTRCVRARLAQEHAHPDAPRAVIAAEIAELDARGEASITEADYLCAVVLDRHHDDAWERAALARMLFEPRSESTVENAQRASVILRQRGIRRAVIVSTPVVRDGREVDNHARRALGDFQADRARGLLPSLLGAVSCPDREGGAAWSAFEGVAPAPRSR